MEPVVAASSPWRRTLLCIAAIALAALVAYWPALRGGFVWDDDVLLTDNALVKAPDGLRAMWFSTQPIDYWPVSNTTFWLEWRLWGRNPVGYHVTNLLLHIAASLLVSAVLSKLGVPAAALAGILFAVHPTNVEAVAWIAQRKTILALVFFLLSILCFVNAAGRDQQMRLHRRWYLLSIACFALAMFSKGSVATLPLIVLLILWWQRGRVMWRDAALIVPYFLIAVPLVLVNIWFQTHGSGEIIRSATLVQRLLGACAAIWFYAGKALLPLRLMFVYPMWSIDLGEARWWIGAAGVAAVTLTLWRLQKRPWARAGLFAWMCFCLLLAPVLGLTDVYFMKYSLVADHYVNLALPAVIAVVVACWARLHARAANVAIALAVLVVIALTFQARRQMVQYRDIDALWSTTIERNPKCWLAHVNYGLRLATADQRDDAIAHYRHAIAAKADYPEAHNNLANELLRRGQLPEAIEHYRAAIAAAPKQPSYHNNLATALTQAGKFAEAIEACHAALQLKRDYHEGRINLGAALLQAGRFDEAAVAMRATLELKKDDPVALNTLGAALAQSGRLPEATAALEKAVQLQPDYVDAHVNLALTLGNARQLDKAIVHLQRAIELRPKQPHVHQLLGDAYRSSGKLEPAIEQYRRTIELKPDQLQAYVNLLETLASVGRRADAIATAERAIEVSRAAQEDEAVRQFEEWLARYRATPSTVPAIPPPPPD